MSTLDTTHFATVGSAGEVEFACTATAGNVCRLLCASECIDYHRETCDGSTKDGGVCGALPYLTADDPEDTYIGVTLRTIWTSGPIEVEWDSNCETWLWRFLGESCEYPPGGRRWGLHTAL